MKKNLVLLSWLGFMVSLGFGSISAVLPYYILYLAGKLDRLPETFERISGASSYALEYTALMSAFMLTRAMMARYFGTLSDRVGRKKIILVGTLFYVLMALAYIASSSTIHLYLIRGFQGIASAMVWPVAEALLMDTTDPSYRGRAMAVYMIANNLAMTSGPAIGAAIYKFGVIVLGIKDVGSALKFPFYGLALFSSLAIPATLLLEENSQRNVSSQTLSNSNIQIKISEETKRSIKAIYAMAIANGVGMGLTAPLYSIFIIEFIKADPAAVATVTTIAGLLGLMVTYPAGRISDSMGRRPVIISGTFLSRLTTMLIPFSKSLKLFGALSSIRSIAFNFSMPSFRALQADIVPREVRGKIFGTVQAAFNIGAVIGPLIGGHLYQLYAPKFLKFWKISIPGAAVPFFISAVIGLITLLVFIKFVKEPRSQR
ncbi:MAG: hypothetical protein DRO00_04365 [Thermoproteota archaeon]|nr:MAG: hypothetical protein DRO00_04365 [Candidatus Korarchaeota archaeon]